MSRVSHLKKGLLIPNLGLAAIEGVIFFAFLLILPKDPKNNLFLGLSTQRLLLLAGVFTITLVLYISIIYFCRNPHRASKIDAWLLRYENRIPMLLLRVFLIWVIIFVGLVLFKRDVLLILENGSYITRLFPFWGWALLIPFQLACFWFYEWKRGAFTLPFFLTLAFFIGTLFLGLKIYQDYGLAWDEPNQVDIGRTNWYYIREGNLKLLTFKDRYYGPAYELLILRFNDSWDTRQLFPSRHLFNFLFFLAGVAAFFWLAHRIFASKWLALLASLFLLLSPRIFADSFYNTKDIPFMVALIFALCTMMLFLDKPGWEIAGLHGVTCAFLIAVRVTGIFILVITLAFLAARWFSQSWKGKILGRELLAGLIYLVSTLGLMIIFWPILWHDPLGEFTNALKEMSHFPFVGDILYLGHIMSPAQRQLPWHYIPVWISISTPLIYLACFSFGVIFILIDLFRQPGKFYEGRKRDHLIFLACFFGPVLAVIMLRSTLYNGWRQMFFIYPSFILIAVQGLQSTMHFLRHRFRPSLIYPILAILLVIGLSDPISFMVRNHPFENMYFNRLAGKNMLQIKQRFEFDYWGLAFKQGIEYILESDPDQKIPIFVTPPGIPYINNLLPDNLRSRLVVKDSPDQARYFMGIYGSIPEEYPFHKKIFSVNVDGASLLSIFDLRVAPDNQSK
jgi:hypothetical protein